MQTVTTTAGPPQTITVNQADFNCRFHPTDWWHEVGCPHRDWTKEELRAALVSQKQHAPGIIKILNDQFSSTLKMVEDRQKDLLTKIRWALRIGNDEQLIPACEKRMRQVDDLMDKLTEAERIGSEQYQRAQSLQLSLLEQMELVGELEERLKKSGKRNT